jgi:hypothetical protein
MHVGADLPLRLTVAAALARLRLTAPVPAAAAQPAGSKGPVNNTHPHLAYLGEPQPEVVAKANANKLVNELERELDSTLDRFGAAAQAGTAKSAAAAAAAAAAVRPNLANAATSVASAHAAAAAATAAQAAAAAKPPPSPKPPRPPMPIAHHAIQPSEWPDYEEAARQSLVKHAHGHVHLRPLRVPAFPGAYGVAAVANLSAFRWAERRRRSQPLYSSQLAAPGCARVCGTWAPLPEPGRLTAAAPCASPLAAPQVKPAGDEPDPVCPGR